MDFFWYFIWCYEIVTFAFVIQDVISSGLPFSDLVFINIVFLIHNTCMNFFYSFFRQPQFGFSYSENIFNNFIMPLHFYNVFERFVLYGDITYHDFFSMVYGKCIAFHAIGVIIPL